MPLLQQYIKANHTLFDVKVYGVSAQGGSFANKKSRTTLANNNVVPSNRIIIEFDGNESKDITEPIKWIMD